ncbi:MAG TPA: hypothetical protein VI072_27020 [Polyangiaceae bacterium]
MKPSPQDFESRPLEAPKQPFFARFGLAPIRSVCERRFAVLALVLLTTLLMTPSLEAGLLGDDFVHALILRGSTELSSLTRHPLDLFRFTSPEHNPALFADGILPWWAYPNGRFAFFRPVTAATHWLDYALWPSSPPLMHAHNLLWSALLLGAVWNVYRTLLKPRWLAVFALLLYALDSTHAATVAWIANRNALVACTFSFAAFFLYLKGRQGSRAATWLSPLCFATGLLAAESGAAVSAYLVAYAIVLDDAPLRRRLSSLLPFVLIGIAWRLAWRALGYGVDGSGSYLDPLHAPLTYLKVFPGRALALWLADLAGVAADPWTGYDILLPGLTWVVGVFAALVVGVFVWVVFRTCWNSRTARFFLLGAALATPFAATTAPSDRLLLWMSFGIAGVFAEIGAALLRDGKEHGRLLAFVASAMLGYHVFVNPLLVPVRAASLKPVRELFDNADDSAPHGPSVIGRTFIYVNPPSDAIVGFSPTRRAVLGIPRPTTQRWLVTSIDPVTVTRPSARSLELTVASGVDIGEFFRPRGQPIEAGHRVALDGFHVHVLAVTPKGLPARIRFDFEHSLEDPRYVWLTWAGRKYEAFEPPALGASTTAKGINPIALLLGEDHPLARWFATVREQRRRDGV